MLPGATQLHILKFFAASFLFSTHPRTAGVLVLHVHDVVLYLERVAITKHALKKDQEDSMAKKGYWVVCYRSVSNPAGVSEYSKLAGTALEALGGTVIAGGKPAKIHEAGVDQSVVVVEFESLEKAIAAYESDLYRRALKKLDNAAQRDFRIIEGR